MDDGQSLVDHLRRKASQDVEITVAVGSHPSTGLLEKLEGVNGLNIFFCPRIHMKTVISDGKTGMIQTANLTEAGVGCSEQKATNFEVSTIISPKKVQEGIMRVIEGGILF